ncbi:MAG TPA: DUF5749 family beta-barrel protein [Candidatus Nanoarchaeia archaeon]|nr:DUF5749 family beta-barrel protein [Candidatus Nanoarchaeia archaeon]
MGIKHTINKIFGVDAPIEVPDINKTTKTETRQVGSLWHHKHNNLDWHSMSIPHPAFSADQDVIKEDAAKTQKEISQPLDPEMSISKKEIFCKFVVQGKERIGETITLDSRLLIIKSGAENLSIPVASILKITKEEVKVGEFDRDKALALGIEWTRRTTDKLNFDEKGMLIND